MKIVMTKALQKRLMNMPNDNLAKNLLQGRKSDEVFYLGVSTIDPNQISYIDKSKLERCGPLGRWYAKNRISTRPGRLMYKIFGDLPNEYYENFTNAFIASGTTTNNKKFKFKIVDQEDIKKYYHWSSYSRDCGSLGGSCMRGDTQQKFLEIYCKNPDHVKMAVMSDDSGVVARCLLWYPNADKSLIYFDRIYSTDYEVELKMYQWLVNKKFVQISDKNTIKPVDKIEIRIKLKNLDFEFYPYVDTIRWINGDDINNLEDGDPLHHTDGRRKDPIRCAYSGNIYPTEEELVQIVDGEYRGQMVHKNYAVYVERYNGYVVAQYSYECGYTNERLIAADMLSLYDGSYCSRFHTNLVKDDRSRYFILGDHNFVQIDNIWYHITSSKIECIKGEYRLKEVEPVKEKETLRTEDIYRYFKTTREGDFMQYRWHTPNYFTDSIIENVSDIQPAEEGNSISVPQDFTF